MVVGSDRSIKSGKQNLIRVQIEYFNECINFFQAAGHAAWYLICCLSICV